MDSGDYGYEQHTAELGHADLDRALAEAETLVSTMDQEWAARELQPRATVTLKAGAEDQPLFVFTILIALDENFDREQWPGPLVEGLKSCCAAGSRLPRPTATTGTSPSTLGPPQLRDRP